jgi:hypothetical protein
MKSIVLIVALAGSMNVFAAEGSRSVVMNSSLPSRNLTGNMQIDFFGQTAIAANPRLEDEQSPTEGHRKSPWLAAGLSVLLPGAGEFYAENYWKAALFLAVDVAAWAIAYSQDRKGDNQTSFFQGYANQHWSPGRYAKFSLENYVPQNQRSQYNGLLASNWESLPPSEQVNWSILNRMESWIASNLQEGKYYSHSLPLYGEQQYFELIGKYQQFYHGWDDADPTLISYDQIDRKLATGQTRFTYYAGERGRANDYYNTAKTFVTVAIVNHLLSAIDAAWTASSYNKSLHASVRIQRVPTEFGYTHVPVARVEYSF